MERIEKLGAGILIRPSDATNDSLSIAIDEILSQTVYTKKAGELQQEMLTYHPDKIFLKTLEQLL